MTPWTGACLDSMSIDSPGKNAGVGCHALLQGIILTQRSNQHLLHVLHWQVVVVVVVIFTTSAISEGLVPNGSNKYCLF